MGSNERRDAEEEHRAEHGDVPNPRPQLVERTRDHHKLPPRAGRVVQLGDTEEQEAHEVPDPRAQRVVTKEDENEEVHDNVSQHREDREQRRPPNLSI